MKRQLSSRSEVDPPGPTDLGFDEVSELDQGVAIPELIIGSGHPLDVTEISRPLRFNNSTVPEILRSLTDLEALDSSRESKPAPRSPRRSITKAQKKRRPPVRTSKEQIQAKAVELFLRRGYHGTSTSDICKELGISSPTLYWYFHDKEDILFSVEKNWIESRVQPMVARMNQIDDPLMRLRSFIQEHTGNACLYPETKVLINEVAYLAQEHLGWVLREWAELVKVLRTTIRELQAAGKMTDVPETFAALCLLGMVTWPCNWFDRTRPEGIQGLTEAIEEILFSGLLKTGVSWRSDDICDRSRKPITRHDRLQNENGAKRGSTASL